MQLTVIADPLDSLDPAIDTTLALIVAATQRGHEVQHCELTDLALAGDRAQAFARNVSGGAAKLVDLNSSDVILFRTDPPVNRRYLDATFILDRVDPAGTLLVNDPRGIRIANEKLWALQYVDLCPPTLVTSRFELIAEFVAEHRRCVIKPIDGFGGRGVLRLDANDTNRASIIELLTRHGRQAAVVQPWLDEVRGGNKRIFLHNGVGVAAVLRYPAEHDFRIGMPARVVELTARDREICDRVGPALLDLGQVLVGLDVIGDHLIEVNVTSAGALHKTDRLLGTTLCADFIELLETTMEGTS